MDHRAPASLVRVVQLVEHQAFAGIEANTQVPAGPGKVIALKGEAGPFGFGDLDRFQVRAVLAVNRGVGVVAIDLRNWKRGTVVDQVVDAAVFHINEGHQAINGVGPRVVCGVVLAEAEAA